MTFSPAPRRVVDRNNQWWKRRRPRPEGRRVATPYTLYHIPYALFPNS